MNRLIITALSLFLYASAFANEPLDYSVELTAPTKLNKADMCWSQPRLGTIPPHVPGNDSDQPVVVMVLQHIYKPGSDRYGPLQQMRTTDLGKTWDGPAPIPGFERQKLPNGQEQVVSDFTPRWHAASGKLLGTGHTVVYDKPAANKEKVDGNAVRPTTYAAYDPKTKTWSAWKALKLPDVPAFAYYAGAGCTQRFDLPGGDILLPIYFKRSKDGVQLPLFGTTVVRCRFDGETLSYVEHGTELVTEQPRGLVEPSITKFKDRFFLTLRNDKAGYVATSSDGLKYDEPRKWTWDDGTELGNYNTQQHWVTHSHGLFLVYTRRGANNDHVMRHRAPLFIAQVDPEKLHVIRASEKELMPNRGVRLGNFSVSEVSPNETWVSDAEWMQPPGREQFGADGSVWVSKIRWNKPNQMMLSGTHGNAARQDQ